MSSLDRLPEEDRTAQRHGTATCSTRESAEAVPERQTIQSIVADSDDERWQLARKIACAVFREPALVTPRRMALLGEEGLSAFVDEVRSLAKGFINRERNRQVNPSASGSAEIDPKPERPKAHASRQSRKLRSPAPVGLVQPEKLSKAEALKRRFQMSKNAKAFISDAVLASAATAIALALGLLALLFAFPVS